MSDDLLRWQRKRDFYANAPDWVRQFWSTQPSFNWYCKSRRLELSEAGVLRKLGRDWMVDVQQLEQTLRKQLGEQS